MVYMTRIFFGAPFELGINRVGHMSNIAGIDIENYCN